MRPRPFSRLLLRSEEIDHRQPDDAGARPIDRYDVIIEFSEERNADIDRDRHRRIIAMPFAPVHPGGCLNPLFDHYDLFHIASFLPTRTAQRRDGTETAAERPTKTCLMRRTAPNLARTSPAVHRALAG